MDYLNDYLPCLTLVIFISLVAGISVFFFYFPSYGERLILHPYLIARGKERYRVVTAGFIHNGPFHLLLNLFIIFTLGLELCDIIGQLLLVVICLCSLFAGNICSTIIHRNEFTFTAAGASASAFGLIGAYCMLDKSGGSVYIPFFGDITGIYLFGFILISQIVLIRFQFFKMIDHFAHLGGLISGAAIAIILN